MSAHSQAHNGKVKMTFECTSDERAYIKMLAAKARMNLSEFMLSYVRTDFPKHVPNKETLAAHKEAVAGKGTTCESMEDFWKQMGVSPSACK